MLHSCLERIVVFPNQIIELCRRIGVCVCEPRVSLAVCALRVYAYVCIS